MTTIAILAIFLLERTRIGLDTAVYRFNAIAVSVPTEANVDMVINGYINIHKNFPNGQM